MKPTQYNRTTTPIFSEFRATEFTARFALINCFCVVMLFNISVSGMIYIMCIVSVSLLELDFAASLQIFLVGRLCNGHKTRVRSRVRHYWISLTRVPCLLVSRPLGTARFTPANRSKSQAAHFAKGDRKKTVVFRCRVNSPLEGAATGRWLCGRA